MATEKYPLANNDLYVSEIPKEIIEYYILTKNNIDSHQLNSLKREDKLDDLVILSDQYHLVQYCDSIDTMLPMDVVRCDFHYENIEHQRVIGNYYVPHFYVNILNSQKELIVNDYCINGICNLLGQLPAEKEDIHIGFLTNKERVDEILLSDLAPLKKRLSEHGYRYDDHLIDDFGFFSWEDNLDRTISVVIDLSSNEKQVSHNIRRFLTMEADYSDNDFYCGGKLIYISCFYEKKYWENINPQLLSSLREWIKIETFPYYLFPIWFYYPVSSNVVVDERDWEIRRLIWNFKGDNSKVSNEEHLFALSKVKDKVVSTISCTFGFDLKQEVVFCCVPSSTKESYMLRYEEFSKQVCERLNMVNGFDIVNYIEDSTPKHLGGKGIPQYDFLNDRIKGKAVIVFDDIYTTGNTLRRFCAKLVKRGAYVIGGIVLGMTETNKCHEDYLGYKGYYDMNSDNLW